MAGGRREFREARAECESSVEVFRDKPVVGQSLREPVRRWARKMGCLYEFREARWSRFEGVKDHGRLVDNANTAAL